MSVHLRSVPAILLLIIAAHSLKAQPAGPSTPGEILLGLQKLQTTASVLYIAAHPDDENTKLLAWLASERKVRTGYLSLTRGDGGQNLIGKEQGELLGLLRTQELLAARRIDGAEQFFTRANDFGFSKTPDETFTIWNRDSVLADVVWTIRKFRPDVIICRFPTTGEGGHGHHTASAMLAAEAFDAAADPSRFPQQLAYVTVWQPRRLFWNTFNFGGTNTTAPDQLTVNVGVYNPLLGKSYGEIAAESRTMHKSQGFGTAKTRGESIEYFKQLRGDTAKNDLLAGINTGWTGQPGLAKFAPLTAALASNFKPAAPEASIPALVQLCRQLRASGSNDSGVRYWQQQKLKEAEALLIACSGLWLEATAAAYTGIQGQPVVITTQAANRNSSSVTLDRISYMNTDDSATKLKMGKDVFYTSTHTMAVPASTLISSPYWLNNPHGTGSYVVRDPLLIGAPENNYYPVVAFHVTIGGLPVIAERNIVFKSIDPVKGERYRPLEILPPVTIELADKVLVFSDTAARQLAITVHAYKPGVNGVVSITAPAGWRVQLSQTMINLVAAGSEATIIATVKGGAGSSNGILGISVTVDSVAYSKSIRRLEYDHVPYQFMLTPAAASLVHIDLKKRGTNIGYIPGAGDDVPQALMQAGYTVTMLTDNQLATGNLSGYDAIVAGIRAFNINDRLPGYHGRLMEYVEQGGNFIVQYNTNTRLGPMTAQPGPYPFSITSARVTDEHAAVTFTHPNHPALNFPNKITQADFEGWVQERGIYFAADTAHNYQTVLAMNDKGEEPNEGSLVISPYGKGNFVYTGLVFFRQLPAGNPGAYRLFANLLSLPRHEE